MTLLESVLLAVSLNPAGADTQYLASLDLLDENSTYRAAVTEPQRRSLERWISISCVSGCSSANTFREQAPGLPMGLFRISDQHPLVFALWGGTTTYAISVYEFRPTGIRKVLDQSSRTMPNFSVRGQQISIITTEYAQSGAGMNRPLRHRTWAWNGNNFVEAE